MHEVVVETEKSATRKQQRFPVEAEQRLKPFRGGEQNPTTQSPVVIISGSDNK